MIDASKFIALFRQNKWRLWLLVLLYGTTWAGIHALRMLGTQHDFGELNPAQDRFIAYQYNEFDSERDTRISIRNARNGRLVHDLSTFRFVRGHAPFWNTKGNVVAFLAGPNRTERQVVEIKLDPKPTIVRRKIINDRHVLRAMCNHRDQFTHVTKHVDVARQRQPYLRIMDEAGNELTRVEFGHSEHVTYVGRSQDGSLIKVTIAPLVLGGLEGSDYVQTNGKSKTLLYLDAVTGESASELKRTRGFASLWGDDQHVAFVDPSNPGWTVARVNQPNLPVIKMPKDTIPMKLDARRFAALSSKEPRTLTIYNVGSSQPPKVISISGQLAVSAGVRENKMFMVSGGVLQSVDLDSTATTDLVNLQPWFKSASLFAIVGLPVFGVNWLAFVWRRRDCSPMLEFLAVLLLCIATLLTWSFASPVVYGIDVSAWLHAFIFTTISTWVALLLVWVSTFESIWGKGLPAATLTAAVTLLAFSKWRGSGDAVMFMMAGALFVFSMVPGLGLMRFLCGRLQRRDQPPAVRQRQTQFSLSQAAIATACFAVLFVAMRSVGWNNNLREPAFLMWLLTFTPTTAVVMLTAIWTAMCLRNVFSSFALWIALAFSALSTHFFFSQQGLGAATLGRTKGFEFYVIGFFGALMLFVALRYCRAHSFELTGTTKRLS